MPRPSSAKRRRRDRSNVFLNMPFDNVGKYRDLMIAYVAGLAGLGYRPRSVLEILPDAHRLTRLLTIILECGSSVHDLSCITATGGYPRFNMPFEAGLVAGLRIPFFLFEEKVHRLGKTLSDLGGYDPKIHQGNPDGVLARLRDLFVNPKGQPSLPKLRLLHASVEKLAARIEADQGSLLERQAFSELVYGAQRLAKERGLT